MSKTIVLKGVRLSFPSLFKKAIFEGKETKFEGSFIMDRETQKAQVDMITKAVEDFAIETFGEGKVPKALKRTCLIDGDMKDYDGYENATIFKAGSTRRPLILDRNKDILAEEDGKMLEGGDYVDAQVSFWYSDHPKGGKQILGNLIAVRYVKEGESFSGSKADVDLFDDLEEEEF